MTMKTPSCVTNYAAVDKGYSGQKTHRQHISRAIPLLDDYHRAAVCVYLLHAFAHTVDRTGSDTLGRFSGSVPARLNRLRQGPF